MRPLHVIPNPEDDTQELIIPDETMAMIIRSIQEEPFVDEDEAEPPPPPPVTEHYRHPLAHLDFYFILGALGCMLATTTSMIEQHMLEPLIFSAITLTVGALVFNLVRDRTHVTVTKRPLVLNITLPRWVAGVRPPKTLREAQISAGIRPVDHL